MVTDLEAPPHVAAARSGELRSLAVDLARGERHRRVIRRQW